MYKFWVRQRSEGWKAQGVDRPLASLKLAGYASLYAYRYDWNDQEDSFLIKFSEVLGAAHASEISFVQGKGNVRSHWLVYVSRYGFCPRYDRHHDDRLGEFCARRSAWFGKRRCLGTLRFPSPSLHGARFTRRHELRADAASMEAIFAEVADTDLMTAEERCILAWELRRRLPILLRRIPKVEWWRVCCRGCTCIA